METMEVKKHVDQVLADMQGITVEDQSGYDDAGAFLVKVKATGKIVDAAYREEKDRTYTEYKAVLAEIKGYTDPLDRAEKTVKAAMSEYQTRQRQIAAEKEAEIRRRIIADRIDDAIMTGDDSRIDEPIQDIIVPVEKPKADGTHTATTWKYEIVDPSKINHEYMIPDEAAIGRAVRTMKDKAQELVGEGVRVYTTQEIRVRS